MKCVFCGRAFDESSANKACRNCSLFGGCRMIKCPHCGYETPPEPRWAKWIRNWKGNQDD